MTTPTGLRRYYVSPHENSWIGAVLDSFGGFEKVLRYKDSPVQEIGSVSEGNDAKEVAHAAAATSEIEDKDRVDFAWLHTVGRNDRAYFDRATIRGGVGVSGTQVLEDKFSYALLQKKYGIPGLESYALLGSTQVEHWCLKRYDSPDVSKDVLDRLWMIKDSGANCGDGLFVTNGHNWRSVLARIRTLETEQRRPGGGNSNSIRFVVQEYIAYPELWEGRFKYHLRVYVIVRGDHSVFLHRHALAHIANKPFSRATTDLADDEVHLTNVSCNHHNVALFHACPAVQLEAFLGAEKWARLLQALCDPFVAVAPFLKHQSSADDFSLVGADIMLDEGGQPYLLECNIPPCLGRTNDVDDIKGPEQELIVNLFRSIAKSFVLVPLASSSKFAVDEEMWQEVLAPRENFASAEASSKGLNALAWKLVEKQELKLLNHKFRI